MSLVPVALPRRPRPVAFIASLVIAWLLVAVVALGLRRGPIESDLAGRATAVVRQQTGASAEVTFEGRDGVVHGTFPSEQVAEQARQSAAAVDGVASARLGDDVLIVSTPARPLVVAVEGGQLSVTATVPDRQLRDELLGAAVVASAGGLAGDVTVDTHVAAPPVAVLADLAAALAAVPGDHTVTIDGATVELSGEVPDDAARVRLGDQVLAAVREVVPQATLDDELLSVTAPTADRPAEQPAIGAGAGPGVEDGSLAERLARALDGETITFPTGSLELSAADEALLDRVAGVLAGTEVTVLVAGHSDARGPLALNQVLSIGRARSVVDYLAAHGVPEERMRAAGFGSAEPLEPNDTRVGRDANRRAEISLLP